MNSILIACGLFVAVSAIVGVVLVLISEKFKVVACEEEPKVLDCLGGSNCGGCGYAGCAAYAHAIITDHVSPSLCPSADSEKLSEILHTDIKAKKMVAFVKCSGTCLKTIPNYEYSDRKDCRIAYMAPGHGSKKCAYGCCGFGSCAKVCPYDAIRIVDGLAKVDETKCQACGKCVSICPNNLIEIIPADAEYVVRCSSQNKGRDVRNACTDGCIGCGLCMRVCGTGAIEVIGNLARINQLKCVCCGKCAEKCPSKIIVGRKGAHKQE